MKRVALLYSGEIRDILHCFNNHYNTIILPNKNEYQFDIYFHFWQTPWETNELRSRVLELMKPLAYKFEPYMTFDNEHVVPDPRFPHPKQNFYSMFYGMNEVSKMKQDYENKWNIKYDIVFRMRSDLFFISSIDRLSMFDSTKIHLLNDWAHLQYGLNDQFAFGPSEQMDKLMSAYENLEKMYEAGCAINPECLLGFNAQHVNNLNIEKHHWEFLLFRTLLFFYKNR